MSQNKSIFIAGATGTLGLPLVRALVTKQYRVTGLTRSAHKRQLLEQAGATVAVADALDQQALTQALQAAAPDYVIDVLTAIPKHGPTRAAHMRATNELRVKGTANLLHAANAAGVRRIVGESMIFAYGFGDHGPTFKTEADAVKPHESKAWLQEIVDGLRSLEDQLLAANAQGQIEAIPLRYGLIYGVDPTTAYMLSMLRKRQLPVVSGTHGCGSWIHTSDAVAATIAALEHGQPGEIYNIVDNEPVSLNDFLIEAAQVVGAKRPFAIPLWLLRRIIPYVAVFADARLRVSNQKAQRDLGWRPQFASYREGLRQIVADKQQ